MLRSPSVVVHSGVALVLLLFTTVLSIYKPRGVTRYGQRKIRGQRRKQQVPRQPHREPAQVLVP
jgi:hypothetical protein